MNQAKTALENTVTPKDIVDILQCYFELQFAEDVNANMVVDKEISVYGASDMRDLGYLISNDEEGLIIKIDGKKFQLIVTEA